MEFENVSASYDVGIAKKYGIQCAVLLNKLLYLSKYSARDDGYCWRTAKELEDELGLTRNQQELAIKKLEEAGIIETKNTYIIGTQIKCKHFKIIGISDFIESTKSDLLESNISDLLESRKSVNNNNTIIIKHNNKKNNNINIITKKRFKKPTIDEINKYCIERNNHINAETFYDFYESKDWYVGKNKMKDWKACIRTWEKRNKPKEEKLPDWWNKTNKDFEEVLTDEERRELEAIKNGTYRA